MKKAIVSLLAGIATMTGLAATAWAGDYHACTVSDVQYVKVGTTSYYVFKASCSDGTYFWYAPLDAQGNDEVRSLVTAATLSNRQINLQCGMNGGTCAAFTTNVYSNNVHSSQTVWSAETVNLRQP